MPLFAKVGRAIAAAIVRSAGIPLPSGDGRPFWGQWPLTSAPNATSAESLAAVVRCVSLYSDAVASLPLNLMVYQPDGGAARTLSLPILQRWSYIDRELFAASALLSGNGFALIGDSLQSFVAHRVVVEIDPTTGEPFYRVTGYAPAQQPKVYDASRMLHLRYRVFDDYRRGDSPLTLARTSVNTALETGAAQSAMMQNLSASGIILSMPGKLGPDDAKEVKSRWEEAFGGGNRGRAAILSNGMTAARLEWWKASDQQLLEFARFSVAEIARLFGVPLQLLGETASLNYSTAVELSRTFYVSALGPFLDRVEAELSAKLLTDRQRGLGQCIEFDTESLTLAPGKESADYFNALCAGGILTPNECRNSLGYDDLPDGDKLRAPSKTPPQAEPPTPKDFA